MRVPTEKQLRYWASMKGKCLPNSGQFKKGSKLSKLTKQKMRLARTAVKNHRWTGEIPSYAALHDWLHFHFGKADKCENVNCKKISKMFHYALFKGKTHERKRGNFDLLCASCHRIYDRGNHQLICIYT